MKRMSKYYALGAALLLLPFVGTSCTDQVDLIQEDQVEVTNALLDKIVAILAQDDATRVSHEFIAAQKTIKNAWETSDEIIISPAHKSANANTYHLTTYSGSGAEGTFTKQGGPNVDTNSWGVYYPSTIKSDVQFYNFSYKGQVQQKSAPMAHMKDYHTMMVSLSGTGVLPTDKVINFSSAKQSSCFHLALSGDFVNPQSISLSYVNANGFVDPVFYETNYINGNYKVDPGVALDANKQVSTISLGLTGYTSETKIDAYIMTSNAPITFAANGYLLVRVKCASSAYFCRVPITANQSLQGGKVMNINCSKWYPDTVPFDATEILTMAKL